MDVGVLHIAENLVVVEAVGGRVRVLRGLRIQLVEASPGEQVVQDGLRVGLALQCRELMRLIK